MTIFANIMRKLYLLLTILTLAFTGSISAREITATTTGGRVPARAYLNDSTITVVHIPATVREIEDYAFEGCSRLERVIFEPGSRLTKIGDYSFADCVSLSDFKIPSSVRTLGTGMLMHCESIKEIDIPRGVQSLPRFFARGCTRLTSVTLPKSVTAIHRLAFAGCLNLSGIVFPASLRHIGMNAFAFCTSLKEVTLPAHLTTLESYAFAECTSLESVTLPREAREIGELIFSGCRSLRTITVPRNMPPSFECNSFIFEPDETEMYAGCTLRIPASALSRYRSAHGWRLFPTLTPLP